jgi:penicillin-insensitive murein endopeptidase
MKCILTLPVLFIFLACNGQKSDSSTRKDTDGILPEIALGSVANYYRQHAGDNQPSRAIGSVSNGKLVNGKLMPFKGNNFQYFDTTSYLAGRAFTHSRVKEALLKTYKQMETAHPGRKFFIMECSNEEGGKIHPHRTHQNGLSIDLMMPLVKDSAAYYGLDTLGKDHYWLEFDNKGRYTKDPDISIDLDLVAGHLLELEKQSRSLGLKLSKVIIKTELREKLYATPNGRKLKGSGIYLVQNLTPLINSLHDDHYHVDFEIIK